MSTQNDFTKKKRKGSSGKLEKNTFTYPKHKFQGWSTDPDSSIVEFTDEQKITFSSNLDLYAVWLRYFDIIFDLSSATNIINQPQDQEIEDGTSILLPICESTKTNYYFSNWLVNEVEISPATRIVPDDDCYIEPLWKAVKTVKFDINGGTGSTPDDQIINSNDGIALPNCYATKTDAIFDGWNVDSTATTKQYDVGYNLKNTFPDLIYTLYAVWKAQYTTLFITGDPSYDTWSYITFPGSTITAPGSSPTPKKTGYQFMGWSEYEELQDQDEHDIIKSNDTLTPTSSKTYYSYFVPKYTLSYNTSGLTGTTPTSTTVVRGTEVTVAQNNLSKEHTTQEGWKYTDGDGNTTYYSSGDKIELYSDITLVPNYVWYINIQFNLNGGTGTTPDEIWTQSGSFTFPTCTATKSGYNFIGWATSSIATEADNVANDTKTVSSSKTYYAVWEEVSSGITIPDCFVTTSTADGVASATTTASKTIATNVYIPKGSQVRFKYTLKHNGVASDKLQFYLTFNGSTICSTTTVALPDKGTSSGTVTGTYNGNTATSNLGLYMKELMSGCVGARLELTNIKITY